MKRITLAIALLILILKVSAQEKLITQNGDVKLVYNVAIAANKVFYTLDSNEDSPILQINKADILTIIHPDGTKELFNLSEADDTKTTEPANSLPPTTSPDTHPIYTTNHKYHLVQYFGKAERLGFGEVTSSLYIGMQLRDSSILEDDNLAMEYKVKQNINEADEHILSWTIAIEVKNKTNQTIYIDLGNSFMIRGNNSEPYYIPSVTTTTQGTTKGASVNLGGISNALGVGGVAGSVLGGVNVGGGTTSQTTTTTYAQRVIAIPAMTRKELPEKLIFIEGQNYKLDITAHNIRVAGKHYVQLNMPPKTQHVGEVHEYNSDNSPLNYSTLITYSLDETFAQAQMLQAIFFAKQTIAMQNDMWHINRKNLISPDYKDNDYFLVTYYPLKN